MQRIMGLAKLTIRYSRNNAVIEVWTVIYAISPVQQSSAVQKRASPGNLCANVHQVSSHRMMISIGKIDLQVQLAGCARVSQQGTRAVQTSGR